MADDIGQVVQQDEQTDRRDTLREAFDRAEQAQATIAPKESPDQPQEAKAPVDRPRDPTGKFTKAERAKADAEAAKAVQTAAPAEPVEEPVWKRPPKSWKKDYHDVWATADDRLKEYAYQREEQMAAGVQPLLTKAEFADQISKVAEPYMPTIKGLGLDVPTVVKAFFDADNILRNGQAQQKLQYLVHLAQNYGIDLSPLTGQQIQAPAVDPNYHALMNELNKVKGELKTWQERQEEAQNQVLMSDIQKFAQAHEHFETVRPVMVALLQGGQAETLDDAYKKAVRLDDSLFESEIEARQAGKIAEKDKAAKVARSAAVSVRGSAPGTNTAPKAQTRRDVLAEQFSSMESRV